MSKPKTFALLGILLTALSLGHTCAAEADAVTARLLRGITLTNATIESVTPSTLKLGAVELAATDLHLTANVSVQISCNYWGGTFTNKAVQFGVRVAEDPAGKARHELARKMIEEFGDRAAKGQPQLGSVFKAGTNYVLLALPDTPKAEFLLSFDGRIIQGVGLFSDRFPFESAAFAIDGHPAMEDQAALTVRKVLKLYKQGAL